ncbi:MAG: LysR family transcriptional regulator [Myxococcales bacterium]|nr:MAG: LysR family transcriptional regulator [Myxococcales bacterium]
MSLTDEGRALHARCTQTIADLEGALDALAGRQDEPRGVLRMTVPDAYGRHRVLPVLARFLTAWPGLEAEVSFSDRLADVIAESFDLALRFGYVPRSEELISRVVTRIRASLYASPDYLARHGEPRTLEDVPRHECLQFFPRDRRQPWYLRSASGEPVELETRSRVRFDSAEALRDAAAAGLGIAQLPDFLTGQHLANGRLRRILEAHEREPAPLFAIYPTRKHLASRVRLFIDRLVSAEQATAVSPAPSGRDGVP